MHFIFNALLKYRSQTFELGLIFDEKALCVLLRILVFTYLKETIFTFDG